MMMTIKFDRPWNEQPKEVQDAINEHDYNEVAKVLGFKLESKKKWYNKLLTNIAKYGILRS